ncbi:MAG: TIR domain-containing protein [Leptolyngbyaceae cyanobacterium MO_188.B28]|nr:TIR domain-containing protein [Leptolyngbyaceae cyanobacterium MO_188.B28]
MTCFSWLHLTDLHQGVKKRGWLWPGVREALFQDLDRLHQQCGPWDLILLTGDLTQHGSVEEFQQVDDLLQQMWAWLQKLGSTPKVLAVPGNHDLVRPDKGKAPVILLQQWNEQQIIQKYFWEDADSDYRQVVAQAFENYNTWWRGQPLKPEHLKFGILPGDFSVTLEKEGAKLGIVGLNTSFLQLSNDDYKGKLALNSRQFHQACGEEGAAWAKQHHACLLLTHHSPAWLTANSQQYLNEHIIADGNFAVHLCGHRHETAESVMSEGVSGAAYIWQGRSFFGLDSFMGNVNPTERGYGYTAGKIQLDKVQGKLLFWPREAHLLHGRQTEFGPDFSSFSLTKNHHTEPQKFDLLQPYVCQTLGKRDSGGFFQETVSDPLDLHYNLVTVVNAIARGQIVPFLGPDINLCDRVNAGGEEESWWSGHLNDPPAHPPNMLEFASYLNQVAGFYSKEDIRCPPHNATTAHLPCGRSDNTRMKMALQTLSQSIETLKRDDLHEALINLFGTEYSPKQYPPNKLHKFFASLPKRMRDKGYAPPYPLIVTTCFDSTLENTFKQTKEPFDLVSFKFDQGKGKFVHQRFVKTISGDETYLMQEGEAVPINEPEKYDRLSLDHYPIILKLYGGMAEALPKGKNSGITEDQYIDYLSHRDVASLLPGQLLSKLHRSKTLFLGYSPSYWNHRVILHRLWPKQELSRRKPCWGVQSIPSIQDQAFWRKYTGRDPIDISLEKYIQRLDGQLKGMSPNPHPQSLERKLSARVHHLSHPPILTKPNELERSLVFISYSHADRAWLTRLQRMLKPLIHNQTISTWDDTKIQPGSLWRDEIKTALEAAKVAVLMVSPNFLASDFIAKHELPPLLNAARKKGLKIIWIYLSPCLYDRTEIVDYQAAHDISVPLEGLNRTAQNHALADICRKIDAASAGHGYVRLP